MQQPGRDLHVSAHAPAHRLFLALWPGDDLRAQVRVRAEALDQRARPHGRLLDPARYHLTLHFLKEHAALPPSLVADVARAAGQVRTPGFDLVLDLAGSFRGVWWLGCAEPPAGLLALWQALATELARVPAMPRLSDALTPHVTILRAAAAALPSMPIAPLHWPVREFVLIHSQPPKPYAVLHRWTLAAPE